MRAAGEAVLSVRLVGDWWVGGRYVCMRSDGKILACFDRQRDRNTGIIISSLRFLRSDKKGDWIDKKMRNDQKSSTSNEPNNKSRQDHHHHHLLQRCQNFQPVFSLSSSGMRNLVFSLVLRLPTHANHITSPITMKATTSRVWRGSANTALLSKNKLTQQKMMGVVIHVLYGRSRSGSRTRRIIRPSTVWK